MSGALLGLLLIFAGGFTITGAAMNWNWFMNSRRARLFVGLFGRQGARVVYVILGVLIALVGAGMLIAG